MMQGSNFLCKNVFLSLQKPLKGFLFAKLYFEAKEYELAKRYDKYLQNCV